jgi:hypothetical protein
MALAAIKGKEQFMPHKENKTHKHRRFDQLMLKKLRGRASLKELTELDELINADPALIQLVLQSMQVAEPDEKEVKEEK